MENLSNINTNKTNSNANEKPPSNPSGDLDPNFMKNMNKYMLMNIDPNKPIKNIDANNTNISNTNTSTSSSQHKRKHGFGGGCYSKHKRNSKI